MSASQHPRHAVLPRAVDVLLTCLLATAVALSVAVSASAQLADVQTATDRGQLLNGQADFLLPVPALSPQLTGNASGGYVHFPFSGGDLTPLLSGPKFNGPAVIGRTTTEVGTSASTGPADEIGTDRFLVGLSSTSSSANCSFSTVNTDWTSSDPNPHRAGDPLIANLRYLAGNPSTVTAKLGVIRLFPSEALEGKYLCLRRTASIDEVKVLSELYEKFDVQYSAIVTRGPINITFEGSRYTPPATEQEPEAGAIAPETAAPAPETAAPAPEPAAPAPETGAAAEPETESAAEPVTESAAPAAAPATTTGIEPTDATSASEAQDTATTESPTLVAEQASDEDSGQDILIPVLLGLIVVLLGGLVVILARGRRTASAQVPAATVAPSAPTPPGSVDELRPDPNA